MVAVLSPVFKKLVFMPIAINELVWLHFENGSADLITFFLVM